MLKCLNYVLCECRWSWTFRHWTFLQTALLYIINSHPSSVFCTLNLDFPTWLTNKHFGLSCSGAVCQLSQPFSLCVVSAALLSVFVHQCLYFLQEIFLNIISHHTPYISLVSRVIKLSLKVYFMSSKCQKRHTKNNQNLKQEITVKNLFVFIFCDQTDNFDGNGNRIDFRICFQERILQKVGTACTVNYQL